MELKQINSTCYQAILGSDTGNRKINQDRTDLFSHNGIDVMVLADGLGGHPRGEVAAEILMDCARLLLRKYAKTDFHATNYISDVMHTAHRKIVDYGLQQTPKIDPRTTAIIVTVNNDVMHWSHLGDSRTYLFRHGRAHIRTLDHSAVELMRLKGEISDSDTQSTTPGRSGITRCLGGNTSIPKLQITPPTVLHDKDILLLCSDGVWSQLTQEKLEKIILNEQLSLKERTTQLIEHAVQAKAPYSDNATALVFQWQGPDNETTEIEEKSAMQDDQTSLDSAVNQLQNLIKRYS